MGGATIGVMYYVDIASFPGFLAMFLVLFVTTGVGNGSTFRMIPSIFREEKLREAECAGETARGGAESGRHRERCGDRLYLGDWCVRRVRDPTRVRRLDRHDRRAITWRSRSSSYSTRPASPLRGGTTCAEAFSPSARRRASPRRGSEAMMIAAADADSRS